jgi:hypothetical protein
LIDITVHVAGAKGIGWNGIPRCMSTNRHSKFL